MTGNGLHGLTTGKLTPRIRDRRMFAVIAVLSGGIFLVDYLTPGPYPCGCSISCRLSLPSGYPLAGVPPP